MDAGRELDALVAEKVMGWQWFKHPERDIRYFRPAAEFRYGAISEGGYTEYTDQLPHYSTDIAAAWQLIEQHPHYVYLMRSVDVTRFGFAEHMTWKCRFYAPQSLEVEAETAPLAICLAALKAVEAL